MLRYFSAKIQIFKIFVSFIITRCYYHSIAKLTKPGMVEAGLEAEAAEHLQAVIGLATAE